MFCFEPHSFQTFNLFSISSCSSWFLGLARTGAAAPVAVASCLDKVYFALDFISFHSLILLFFFVSFYISRLGTRVWIDVELYALFRLHHILRSDVLF